VAPPFSTLTYLGDQHTEYGTTPTALGESAPFLDCDLYPFCGNVSDGKVLATQAKNLIATLKIRPARPLVRKSTTLARSRKARSPRSAKCLIRWRQVHGSSSWRRLIGCELMRAITSWNQASGSSPLFDALQLCKPPGGRSASHK
jgi:hypothetical protein